MKTPILLTTILLAGAASYWVAKTTSQQQAVTATEEKSPQQPAVKVAVAPPAPVEIAVPMPPPTKPQPMERKAATQIVVEAPFQPQIYIPQQAPVAAPAAPVAVETPKADPMKAAWQAAEVDGYAAMELAMTTGGRDRIDLIRHGISLIAKYSVGRALEMANSLTEGHDHSVAVSTIIREVGQDSLEDAADILLNRIPAETAMQLLEYPRTKDDMQLLVSVAAKNEPQAAVKILTSIGFAADSEMVVNYSMGATSYAAKIMDPHEVRGLDQISAAQSFLKKQTQREGSSESSEKGTGWSSSLPGRK